ncbi:MAG: LysR substrate-binding domain-containing protein [Burkholderiales bacterium]
MATLTTPAPRSASLLRSRPIGVGQLRAFAAVARHLNFRAAADEMALTQSAVSRQIQALEEEVGVALFRRHTRAVELTGAGAQLLRAAVPSLERIDGAVRQIRHSAGRKSVAITTWASLASMWLIPRLEAFQHTHPDIDIRIDASDAMVDLETADIDLALRAGSPGKMPRGSLRLFGEQLAPVASPWLLKSGPRLETPADLAAHTLIEASDQFTSHNPEWSWQRWLELHHPAPFEPRRWLHFNYAHQIVQAALTGQGVALARMALVTDSLASGELVEVLPGSRVDTPYACWLLLPDHSKERPEVIAFRDWLREQARITRETIGDVPDPDLRDDLD